MNYLLPAKSSFRNALVFMSLLLCVNLFAQEVAETASGIFEFESEVIDYGTIKQNADGVRAFKFKNVGKSPIVITKVKGSCGCTVPTKPDGPIMPGESAEIGVNMPPIE